MADSLLKRRALEKGITTPEAFVAAYKRRAAALGLQGEAISTRTVERWWGGHSERPRNAARLILEAEFGESADVLLAPADGNGPVPPGVEERIRRAVLADITRQGRRLGWGIVTRELHQSGIFVSEGDAASIRTFHPTCVPGPLQTREYAIALHEADPLASSPEQRLARVDARMARKQVFERPQPPQYWAILDESVLRRVVGGREVMVEQLDYLAGMARRPSVRISVLPFEAGAHPSPEGSFTIHDFADPGEQPAVYLGTATDDLYLERAEDIAGYRIRFDRMSGQSLGFDESLKMIEEIAASMRKEEQPR